MKNCKGFSLVEVMMVVGVMMIVLLGASTFMLDMKRTQNRMQASEDVNSLQMQVRSVINNDLSCETAFKDMDFAPTDGQIEVPELTLPNGSKIKSGEELENYKLLVNKILLKGIPEESQGQDLLGGNVYYVELALDLKTTRPVAGDGELGERFVTQFYMAEKKGKMSHCGRTNLALVPPPSDDEGDDNNKDTDREPASTDPAQLPLEHAKQICGVLGGKWDTKTNSCDSDMIKQSCKMMGGSWKNGTCHGAKFTF